MKRKIRKLLKLCLALVTTLGLLGLGGLWRLSVSPLRITKDERITKYIPKSIQFDELYLRAGSFYTIPELELTMISFSHEKLYIKAPKLYATWKLSNLLYGDMNVSSVRIVSPQVDVTLPEIEGQKTESSETEPGKDGTIKGFKSIFEKIPVKYIELSKARVSIFKGKDTYRFSDTNFYALQLKNYVSFQIRGFFSDTKHKPFLFDIKSKLEKESLDLSGKILVNKVILADLPAPPKIKEKLAFYKAPISFNFIYNFYPSTKDFHLSGKAQFFLGQNNTPVIYAKAEKKKEDQMQVSISAKSFKRQDLDRIWIPHEDKIRPWVCRSVLKGDFENFTLDLSLKKNGQDYGVSDVSGKIGLVDVDLMYKDDLPPVYGIYGAVHFNKEALWGFLHRGHHKKLQFKETEIKISGFQDDHLHIDGGIYFDGPLADFIDYINHGFLKEYVPKKIQINQGEVSGSLHLSLPLKDKMEDGSVVYELSAQLKKGDLSLVHEERNIHLQDANLNLVKNQDEMRLGGKGNIDGFKAQFSIKENNQKDMEIVSQKRVSGAGNVRGFLDVLPQSMRAQIKAPNSGTVSLKYYAEERQNGIAKVDVDLDLKKTGIYLPLFNWKKQKGKEGRFELSLETEKGVIRHFKKLSLVGQDINIVGQAHFDRAGKITELTFSPFQVNRMKGDVRADYRDGILQIHVHVPFLNFNPLLASLRSSSSQNKPKSDLSINLDVQVDNLFLKEGSQYKNFHAALKIRNGDVYYANMKGLDNEEKLSVRYEPHEENMVLEVEIPKLDTLLEGLNLSQNLKAGKMQIQAQKPLKDMDAPLKGKLFVDKIRVLNAPAFAKLLRLISVEGLLQNLAGEGLVFSDNYAKFEFKDQAIALSRAYMMNSSIGITAKGYIYLGKKELDIEGVLVPANFINQILGNIPIIGQLLSGGKDQGLFSVSYSAKGPLKDPKISSNPLGVVAPNILKSLFSKHQKKPTLTA